MINYNEKKYFGFEELQILENHLTVLQVENHLEKIDIWGRVYGQEHDYTIAYGYAKDVLNDLKFYYTTDLVNWTLLPSTDDSLALNSVQNITEDFTGIPSLQIKNTDNDLPIKEEDRLSLTIQAITNDCFLIPRGYLLKMTGNKFVRNPGFAGLREHELLQLNSYCHLRVTANESILEKSKNFIRSIDAFDTIEFDPIQSWSSVRFTEDKKQIVIRSLNWPGYCFMYDFCQKIFSSVYCGHGLANKFNSI